MVNAIVNQLKTGTIKTVIARGSRRTEKKRPYVVVWREAGVSSDGSTIDNVYVAAHHLPGNDDIIEDYVNGELYDLLHKVILQDSQTPPNSFKLWATNDVSGIVEGNDDGTISIDRRFIYPNVLL